VLGDGVVTRRTPLPPITIASTMARIANPARPPITAISRIRLRDAGANASAAGRAPEGGAGGATGASGSGAGAATTGWARTSRTARTRVSSPPASCRDGSSSATGTSMVVGA